MTDGAPRPAAPPASALRDTISRAAARERELVAREAEAAIAAVRDRAALEEERELARARAELAAQIDGDRARVRAEAESSARAALLGVRRAALDAAYAEAEARALAAEGGAWYEAVLRRLVVQAAAALPDPRPPRGHADSPPAEATARTAGAIAVRARDRAVAEDALARAGLLGRVELADEGDRGDAPAGTVLALGAEGGIRIDNGISARLARARGRLDPEIAAILLGNGPS